jgi:aerobic-type carbon monoxide dehydrogenase small subunit (CoxS/CutS family)
MTEHIVLDIDGRQHAIDADPDMPLLYALRDHLQFDNPRFGCGLGQCGACTVIINGAAVRSCITPVSTVRTEITTLEGISSNGKLHPIQQAWIDEQVPQCGFCQNGQIMTAKAMLDKNPHPTDAQIRETMNSTLCRCFTHFRVQTAIKRVVAKGIADASPASAPTGKEAIA